MKSTRLRQGIRCVLTGLALAALTAACAPARPAGAEAGVAALFARPPATATPQATQVPPTATPTQAPVGTAIGMQAPDFTLTTTGGKTVSLSDYRGQVVLLNFWATWCGPCRMEVPGLVAAYGRFKEQGFTIVAVNMMEPKENVTAFAREWKMSFPVLLDPDGVASSLYVGRGIPTSYLLDRNGIVRQIVVGAMPDEFIIELIEPYLGS